LDLRCVPGCTRCPPAVVGETRGIPRANTVRPYDEAEVLNKAGNKGARRRFPPPSSQIETSVSICIRGRGERIPCDSPRASLRSVARLHGTCGCSTTSVRAGLGMTGFEVCSIIPITVQPPFVIARSAATRQSASPGGLGSALCSRLHTMSPGCRRGDLRSPAGERSSPLR